MLKIEALNSFQFVNALHVQCITEIKDLTVAHNPAALGVINQFNDFALWYDREGDAYKFIRKSEVTEAKARADQERDATFTGMRTYVNSFLYHYNAETAAAARRLKIVIDGFNQPEALANLSYDAETAAITSLIRDLSARPADVAALNLQDWITALQAKNQAFDALADRYIGNIAEKPAYNMRQARSGVEKSMRTMFDCINALIVLNGEAPYTAYVNGLNAVIKHYNDVYAVHIGRYEANKDKGSENHK
jgi:hypothetical protein